MTTIVTGINKQAILTVLSSKMDYARQRWEVLYNVRNQSIEPLQDLNTLERTAIIRNIPAQVDGEGVEIVPADNQLDEFRDQIVSAGMLDEASLQSAINHAETIGIFVEYVDPTDDAWENEVPTAPPIDETTPWVADVFVARGMLRSYNGEVYRVVQSHTTQLIWAPDITPALWILVPQSVGSLPPWEPFPTVDPYPIGAEVSHVGEDWLNRRANNTFEPGTASAGWLRTSNQPYEWFSIGNEGYPINFVVTQNGTTYIATTDNSFGSPDTLIGWAVV